MPCVSRNTCLMAGHHQSFDLSSPPCRFQDWGRYLFTGAYRYTPSTEPRSRVTRRDKDPEPTAFPYLATCSLGIGTGCRLFLFLSVASLFLFLDRSGRRWSGSSSRRMLLSHAFWIWLPVRASFEDTCVLLGLDSQSITHAKPFSRYQTVVCAGLL
jgi:hypothetical protein